ncbi:AAA family ATPase [Arcanobacterium haemolyticum]|uniref:AAA family ATPase n=1 Tax=Arcanobacterium haemolyticum TaxID=28264 RepID=UPI0018D574C5|nr:AAA family ATPase [Arcanobacterium haemolyticum]
MRRAGKSTLLYGIVQDLISQGTPWNNIIYINFEDERLVEFTTQDFNSIITLAASMSDGAPGPG